MLMDHTLILADEQAITEDTAGKRSSTALVVQPGGDDYSTMWVAIVVKEAFTTSGSPSAATIKVALQTDSASDFSSNVELEARTLTLSALKAGDVIAFKLPLGLKKYLRCYFDVTLTGGTTPAITAGKLTVGLTDGIWAK